MADVIVTPSVPAPVTVSVSAPQLIVQAVATGPSGSSGASFNHTQGGAASVWTINHNLGFKPSLTLFDVGGAEMEADVLHLTLNTTQVTFNSPVAGSARLV